MKLKICFTVLMASTLVLGYSQAFENTVWRITRESLPYPQGNYWNFNFKSDSTYLLNDRFSKTYKLDPAAQKIQIPSIEEYCPYEINGDKIKINCAGFTLMGEKMNARYSMTQSSFKSKHFNIILPLYDHPDSLPDKIQTGNPASVVNIYMSSYIKSEDQIPGKPEDTYIQVHFQNFRIAICDLRDYCNDFGISRKIRNNAILEQFPEHNKTEDSYVVLYIDGQVAMEDVKTVIWRISQINSVRKIFFAVDDTFSKDYHPVFKEFDKNVKADTGKSEKYTDWVHNDFPVFKEAPVEKFEIIRDDFEIID